ncbi:MAG: amidohydrolase family protein [Gammaproteobacteria bacterium]|nr:amidohydrolase family protein [Gammaproteobacteria bacterium]
MSGKLHYFYPSILLCLCINSGSAESLMPFADAHIHYNWDHAEIISPLAVVEKLKREKVGLTLVSSTPSHLALELREAGGDWIIPFFSPYIHESGKRDWYLDKTVVKKAAEGLDQGLYFGVGEIHFMGGFLPRPDNDVFLQLMGMAKQHNVPALIHVDASDENYFLGICKAHSAVKIIFAHAGGNLKPRHIRSVLEKCPNVWIDLAARDDWRYGGLTDNKGVLLPAWKRLIVDFSSRFITGTDPVWRVTRTQSWDESDDGWDHYAPLHKYHQMWLANLPDDVHKKIAWDNVKQLLGN